MKKISRASTLGTIAPVYSPEKALTCVSRAHGSAFSVEEPGACSAGRLGQAEMLYGGTAVDEMCETHSAAQRVRTRRAVDDASLGTKLRVSCKQSRGHRPFCIRTIELPTAMPSLSTCSIARELGVRVRLTLPDGRLDGAMLHTRQRLIAGALGVFLPFGLLRQPKRLHAAGWQRRAQDELARCRLQRVPAQASSG